MNLVPDWVEQRLERLRLDLAGADGLPHLALLGLVTGVLAGGVIVAFRLLIEAMQAGLLPGGAVEQYEALEPLHRLALATCGGLLVGLLLQLLKPQQRSVGVVHVMERLAYFQGYLPLRNAVAQFLGAAVSIAAGHSVGREGPGVHLGAASGSQLGQRLRLPNNSIRVLVACGVAASIGASFNTPLAGVIFAMEVVMLEYTIAGFAPVILAAVSGTVVAQLVFGSHPAFAVPPLDLGSLWELPYVLAIGLLIGALAAGFTRLVAESGRVAERRAIWLRCTLAGLIVGLAAIVVPEIMGIGYDTVRGALLGELALGLLLAVTLAKLVVTALGIGLGLPAGLIGPCFVIGATAGGAMGLLADKLLPMELASASFYAMIGMGAMMAATLQAPLAALIALLELTANPNILLPGMLAVVSASLTSRLVFGQPSVFHVLLRIRGLDYRQDPRAQSLLRVGVGSIMDRSFHALPRRTAAPAVDQALKAQPRWILVRDRGSPRALLAAVDLARWRQEHPEDRASVDLLDIPGKRLDLAPVPLQASLQEAVQVLSRAGVDALCVQGQSALAGASTYIYGVLTQADIDRYEGY